MRKKRFDIIFENEDYIIINKPAGMLVIPDRYDQSKPCLVKMLDEKNDGIFVVHRIDMDTSGAICFARNAESHKHLSQLFENNKVDKSYLAICGSTPTLESGKIDTPIKPSETNKGKMICHPKGKKALTHYTVKERFGTSCLLEVKIETGRTHQIRVHLSFISCPLIVDKKYGQSDAFYLSHLKRRKYNRKKEDVERPLMSRQSLHAWKLSFLDSKGNMITAEANMPKDFKAVLNQLRKNS